MSSSGTLLVCGAALMQPWLRLSFFTTHLPFLFAPTCRHHQGSPPPHQSRLSPAPSPPSPSQVDELDLFGLGPKCEKHAVFPAKINTEFVEVLSRQHVRMVVWERGAGRTLACGTGACATVVAGAGERARACYCASVCAPTSVRVHVRVSLCLCLCACASVPAPAHRNRACLPTWSFASVP